TKPQNENLFAPLGFYPVAKTDTVLLMENRKAGISQYKDRLKHETGQKKGDPVGAVVANCNPFTKGHRYLIETAASQCGLLHLFILTDGKVSLKERMALVKQGTQHIPNLVIHETGDYLVSRISFPDYFIKEAITEAWYDLDIAVFCTHIVPTLGITKRFVGTEPTCAVTSGYNKALKEKLPQQGVEIIEIPRLTINHTPVSASEVRRYLQEGQPEKAEPLVVEETLETIKKIYAFKREEDL
ncbi:MAG: [citrate (pro-3S)-lyase] ligase, partial [Eubacterium sp.]